MFLSSPFPVSPILGEKIGDNYPNREVIFRAIAIPPKRYGLKVCKEEEIMWYKTGRKWDGIPLGRGSETQ